MIRLFHASLALIAVLAALRAPAAIAATEQQEIVDKATLTVEKMLSNPEMPTLRRWMKHAKGVVVIPSLIKGGFFFGLEGGSGVLLSRNQAGEWSYPAFYTIGAGSFGFQAGVQDAEAIFVIMTDRGLDAVMDKRVKLGADASIAAGPKGGVGVEGATTAGLGADIYSFSTNRGIYAGVSVEGAAVVERNAWNQAYYGNAATPKAIVVDRTLINKAADKLRRALAAP